MEGSSLKIEISNILHLPDTGWNGSRTLGLIAPRSSGCSIRPKQNCVLDFSATSFMQLIEKVTNELAASAFLANAEESQGNPRGYKAFRIGTGPH